MTTESAGRLRTSAHRSDLLSGGDAKQEQADRRKQYHHQEPDERSMPAPRFADVAGPHPGNERDRRRRRQHCERAPPVDRDGYVTDQGGAFTVHDSSPFWEVRYHHDRSGASSSIPRSSGEVRIAGEHTNDHPPLGLVPPFTSEPPTRRGSIRQALRAGQALRPSRVQVHTPCTAASPLSAKGRAGQSLRFACWLRYGSVALP
jgi:hypothetical protein